MENVTIDNLGVINLKEKVMVSDPCYGLNTWCQGVLENVLPGEYQCFLECTDMKEWGNRVSAITVTHSDYVGKTYEYEDESFEVGVDSGQAGIYDYEYYSKFHCDAKETHHCDDGWYGRACNLTFRIIENPNYKPFDRSKYDMNNMKSLIQYCHDQLDWSHSIKGREKIEELYGGLIDKSGFVSSSGFGDGGYSCMTSKNEEGKIVSIQVRFIFEDD